MPPIPRERRGGARCNQYKSSDHRRDSGRCRYGRFDKSSSGAGRENQSDGDRRELALPAPERCCGETASGNPTSRKANGKRKPAALGQKTSRLPGVWKEVRHTQHRRQNQRPLGRKKILEIAT